MNFPSYSFQFNYKLHFLKKYKLISNFSIKIRFLLSLKYLLYLCGFFKDESPKIFFNFKKLNFLFFNYALMFTKFFEYFLPNQYFVIDYDKFDNKYYCKKKRSLKKNRLKKIKIFIRSTKEKYNDSIEA